MQAPPLTELNKQFANTMNHSIPAISPCKTAATAGADFSPSGSSGLGDTRSDEAAQPDLDADEMMCAFASFGSQLTVLVAVSLSTEHPI